MSQVTSAAPEVRHLKIKGKLELDVHSRIPAFLGHMSSFGFPLALQVTSNSPRLIHFPASSPPTPLSLSCASPVSAVPPERARPSRMLFQPRWCFRPSVLSALFLPLWMKFCFGFLQTNSLLWGWGPSTHTSSDLKSACVVRLCFQMSPVIVYDLLRETWQHRLISFYKSVFCFFFFLC